MLLLITILLHCLTPVLLVDESHSCITSITQTDCEQQQQDSVLVSRHGNCPRCETGAKQCQACEKNEDCAPGLKCDLIDDGGGGEPQQRCVYDKSTCHHLVHLPEEIQWKPDCYSDGRFAAKQCRGDKVSGRCFCYGDTGAKIFGWDWRVNEEEMTCACSRRRARLEAAGQLDVTLHCTQNGNYEELQCDRDVCWCADSLTGALQLGTPMVPYTMWKALPCCKSVILLLLQRSVEPPLL